MTVEEAMAFAVVQGTSAILLNSDPHCRPREVSPSPVGEHWLDVDGGLGMVLEKPPKSR